MTAKGDSVAKQRCEPVPEGMLIDAERRVALAARGGDHDAFDALVRLHWSKVASVVGRFLPDPNDIEDATQETFIRAFQHLHAFRGECSLRTWLNG